MRTGWIDAPSGHRWYRDERYPGYGYDQASGQWLLEEQLEAYATATGGAVQADTAASYPYGGYPQVVLVDGWVQGPGGSWRFMDRRYPGYGYDWAHRRWMRHEELRAMYGG